MYHTDVLINKQIIKCLFVLHYLKISAHLGHCISVDVLSLEAYCDF